MNYLLNNSSQLVDINNIIKYNNKNNFDINNIISDVFMKNRIFSWNEYYLDLYKNKKDLDINVIINKIIDIIDEIVKSNDDIDHFINIYNNINNMNKILNLYNYDYIIDNKLFKYVTNTYSENIQIIKIIIYLSYINKLNDKQIIIKKWILGLIKKQTNYVKYWNILMNEILIIKTYTQIDSTNYNDNVKNILISSKNIYDNFYNTVCDLMLNYIENIIKDEKNKIIYILSYINHFKDFIEKYKEIIDDMMEMLYIKIKLRILLKLDKILSVIQIKQIDNIINILLFIYDNYNNDKISTKLSKISIKYLELVINNFINTNKYDYKTPKLFLDIITQFNIINKINIIDNNFIKKINKEVILTNNINKLLMQDNLINYILFGLDYYIDNHKIDNLQGLINIMRLYPNKDILFLNYLTHYKTRIFNKIKVSKISLDYLDKEISITNYMINICDIHNFKKDLIKFNDEMKDVIKYKNELKQLNIDYNDINKKYEKIDKKIDLDKCNYFVINKPDLNQIIIENIPIELQLYCNVGLKYFDTSILTKKLSLNLLDSGIILSFNEFNISCNLLHASILFAINNDNSLNLIKTKLNVKKHDIFDEHIKQLIDNKLITINDDNIIINQIYNDINIINFNIISNNITQNIDKNDNNIELNRSTIIDCYIIKILKEYYILDKTKYIFKKDLFNELVKKLNDIIIIDDMDLFNNRLNRLIDNVYIDKHKTDDSFIYID